ncbi:TRAP transporter permease [Nocardia rhizosphaerihabitans]|uniref:C4-dicarboxylate ABC transporter permease n=1 Tax=Nocardia rhizosphaerihabitans TaxID=1691570 RepID=A0ABQ2KXR3_9NOCA|nr:TRAP transporter fused permease subunit [Nocardia rhizosphaerihabitans]GGN96380.1 C4-dicarboxylate ABC transporter permease [Nocardia rhizosphaerihabitans]
MSAAPPVVTAADLGVDDEERPARVLSGFAGRLVGVVALGLALLAVWQVFRPLAQGSQYYLVVFLAVALPLVYLSYRSWWGRLDRADGPAVLDWVLAAVALLVCLYPILPLRIGDAGGGYNAFLDRQGMLAPLDVVMGGLLLVLVLEACRRTTGIILPAVCLVFLAYGYYGGLLPQDWAIAHAGLDVDQIVDALYNSGSGFYGTPLDVAASYIVLFTLYGAVLEFSGAARFFVDLSVSLFRRSHSAAGRTAVVSGFLLGTVSGSGTATAVSTGAVTWPILRRAGYRPEQAGGMLAAAGVGAILSPPTLGVAAFIVAEYLDVSYVTVLGWALIPTLLYYLGILLSVEIDARRIHAEGRAPADLADGPLPTPWWKLLGRFGYHFSSLIVIVVLLLAGMSATRAVVYATVLALILAVPDRMLRARAEAADEPTKEPGEHTVPSADRQRWSSEEVGQFTLEALRALSLGMRSALPVVAVCAAAGVITAMTTKTGLGAQLASLLVRAGSVLSDDPAVVLATTAVLAAIALSLLGLAVPVTASFVIGWVIIGPALLDLDVAAPAAAMFVFYFSVLSEVTPPTALAAVGAAAVTGAKAMPTMWAALRYALPAFLVPLMFVLTDSGQHLLGRGALLDVLWVSAAACVGVAALAAATGGWLFGIGAVGPIPRGLAAAAGLTLLYPNPVATAIGLVLLLVAVLAGVVDRLRRRTATDTP